MTNAQIPLDFYPPRLNPSVVRWFHKIAPLFCYWHYRISLDVSPECLEKLRSLQNHRLLLLPNHPTFYDWSAIFLLSAQLGDVFHFMAAYERFRGFEGWFLQHMGAYSIRRGLGDRKSVAQTLEIISQPGSRLVIFPEGGCSFQNDTVMPFRVGAIQIALQAMNRMVKHGEVKPDLYAVPISIKYRYTGNMDTVIHNTLSRLEKVLQIAPAGSPYERLRAVAEQVLTSFEKDYGLYDDAIAQADWNVRIPRLKDHVLQACEQKLGITPTTNDLARERVYKIQYMLESFAERLASENFWTYESMHKAAARLLNFDAMYDGYVADHPTPERFLDTLIRLERDVFKIDQPAPKGFRKVFVRVGDPVNLGDYFEQYQQDRSNTVTFLVNQLHQAVQTNLNILTKEVL
jgi:1-acyl-sn-glycerol-3-phosphate acyltransferase